MKNFFRATVLAVLAFGAALPAHAAVVYLSGLSAASSFASTNTFPICQNATACGTGQPIVYGTLAQLSAYIDGALGTVTSGTWHGTVIAPAFGGSGLSSPTANALLIGNGSGNYLTLAEVDGDCAVGAGGVWTTGACGSGGSVTWPATGDLVVSAGVSSNPNGIAEVDGDCIVGSGGSWAAGACASSAWAGSQHGAAATTITSAEYVVSTCNSNASNCSGGTWNTAATWTLPVSTGLANGQTFWFNDDADVINNTDTLTVQPGAGDTMTGGSGITMNFGGGRIICQINTTSKNWTCTGSQPNGALGDIFIGQGATVPGAMVPQSGDTTFSSLGVSTTASVKGVVFNGTSGASAPVCVASSSVSCTWGKVPNAGLSTFIIPLTIGWIPGQNPNNAIVATVNQAGSISSIVGRVETANGSTATVTVNKAASGTSCSAGTAISSSFNANGTAATNQTITSGSQSLAVGDSVCLQTTGGSNWTSGAAAGGITINFQPS